VSDLWLADLAAHLASLPGAEAVALGGSAAAGRADASSDFDLYVYADQEPPLARREDLARRFAATRRVGDAPYEAGDEWVDDATGRRVDVTYRTPAWIEAQLDAVLVEHRASVGYSTCFWWNVRRSRPLFDRAGWFAGLQARAAVDYPEALRRAVVAKNHPMLRAGQSSFLHKIELAATRDDPVGVQHGTATLLASYFDVLFALNRQPHPGDKRLIAWAEELCPRRPAGMAAGVRGVVAASGGTDGGDGLVARVHLLIDGLDELLSADGVWSR
jgi:predicted nucleotidyltransferase